MEDIKKYVPDDFMSKFIYLKDDEKGYVPFGAVIGADTSNQKRIMLEVTPLEYIIPQDEEE